MITYREELLDELEVFKDGEPVGWLLRNMDGKWFIHITDKTIGTGYDYLGQAKYNVERLLNEQSPN